MPYLLNRGAQSARRLFGLTPVANGPHLFGRNLYVTISDAPRQVLSGFCSRLTQDTKQLILIDGFVQDSAEPSVSQLGFVFNRYLTTDENYRWG